MKFLVTFDEYESLLVRGHFGNPRRLDEREVLRLRQDLQGMLNTVRLFTDTDLVDQAMTAMLVASTGLLTVIEDSINEKRAVDNDAFVKAQSEITKSRGMGIVAMRLSLGHFEKASK
ncbi:hypothetical protein QFZ65_001781 [Arthrobacter sp. B3I9]|uniref:hypothetical protein n=1 Tax=Arthrobacter sp. B3I9 TaxID=3042270 RepID=UPI002791AFCC|nr:hypothetical protein [Arthrobacter sp. B3I9]MDQ0849843.1 hypothetical protein [Arthrobacter sp. B3I9]